MSESGSDFSSETESELEEKPKKKRRTEKEKSKKKRKHHGKHRKHREKEVRRSVITGEIIRMERKLTPEQKRDMKNRDKLRAYLNALY